MAALEGRTLDRYELRQLVGRGGMADVYLGYDPRFDREVAIKVFKREDEDLLRRFVREAHLMASLNNPHLMPVYDAGESTLDGANLYYIVMPMMDGGTLRGLVRRSPLALADASRYLSDIAEALDYIHRQGIIHRDIKSSNVLLDAEGRCYLSDFGIARTISDSTQMTGTGNVLGTVDYMAPELFESSDGKADIRSDLYSLGVLLYEMVTGKLPFSAEHQLAVVTMHINKLPPPPRSIVPSIPPAVERVILKALEKRPELRYGTPGELAEAFRRAITMPQTSGASFSNPAWDQETVAPFNAPAQYRASGVFPAPPVVARPAVGTAGTTGRYTAAYGPVYQPSQVYQPTAVATPDPAVRKQARIVTLLAILALLAVIVPVTYVLLTHATGSNTTSVPTTVAVGTQPPNLTATGQTVAAQTQTAVAQQSSHATATAVAGVTATAQAQAQATQQANNATATAVAGATATVVTNATATAGVMPSATAGNPEYNDPLTDANNPTTQAAQWTSSVNCTFKSDGLHVTANALTDTLVGCREAAKQYANFTVQVDLSIQSGSSGGLFFRVKTDTLGAYAGYLFEIDSNGRYKISGSNGFNTGATALRDWTASSALKTGTAKNTLTVIARGGTMLFYINGIFQPDPIQDTTFTTGNIGLLATVANGTSADVVYSNLKIYSA